MPRTTYCWRCKIDVPMLTEDEWEFVNPTSLIEHIKQYRRESGCSLAEAYRANLGHRALSTYESVTGFKESNPSALLHHRLTLYGPPCGVCGKPLRTPSASFCAACGADRAH